MTPAAERTLTRARDGVVALVIAAVALLAGCGSGPSGSDGLPTAQPGSPGSSPEAGGASGTAAEPTLSESTSSDPVSAQATDRVTQPVVALSGEGVAGLSGLTAVPGAEDSGWFGVDDHHGGRVILQIGTDGVVRRIPVAATWVNAEAITSAPCETGGEKACLYVGDIGDNVSARDHVSVWQLPIPTRSAGAGDVELPAVEWRYTYSDGPHNAEALVVLEDAVMVVTKPDDGEAHLVALGPRGGGVLQVVDSFMPPAPTQPLASLVTGVVVTDADYRDGRLLLLTYDQVLAYRAPESVSGGGAGSVTGADLAGFPSWAVTELPFPRAAQAEGIASAADGCGYAVASEALMGQPATVARVVCR